jgi:hypothetical protein
MSVVGKASLYFGKGWIHGWFSIFIIMIENIHFCQPYKILVSQCGISRGFFKFCFFETLTIGCDLIEKNEYNTDTGFKTFYDFSHNTTLG